MLPPFSTFNIIVLDVACSAEVDKLELVCAML
jgi:hypothetical protein